MIEGRQRICVLISSIVILLGFILLQFGSQVPLNKQERKTTPLVSPSREISESTNFAVFGMEGERVAVTKAVDGDTLEISTGQKVRLIGIDTPETVDPRRPVGCFGKEASNETKSLLNGKEVVLEKDVSDTDKYGRLLRYVYLPLENSQLVFVNDYLVREGFAKAYTYPPDVKFNERFMEAEKQARELNKGLWGKCPF